MLGDQVVFHYTIQFTMGTLTREGGSKGRSLVLNLELSTHNTTATKEWALIHTYPQPRHPNGNLDCPRIAQHTRTTTIGQ